MDAQAAGPITIDSPLGEAITFDSMTGSEGLSQIFAYELEVLSPRANLNASDLLGHQVTDHLERGDDEQQTSTGAVQIQTTLPATCFCRRL